MITQDNIAKLDAVMTAQDITNEYLGHRLGVTAQSVRNWRAGKNRPSLATVEAINRVIDEQEKGQDNES